MSEFSTTITQELAAKMTPAEATRLIKGMCIPEAAVAVQTLVEICQNRRINPNARVSAAVALLDRGFGKPEQTQQIVAPGNGRSGVMLIPSADGEDAWLQLATQHHAKMLASHGPHSQDPNPSS